MDKKCCQCRKKRNLADFAANRSKKDRLQTICKECSRRKNKEWYAKNRRRKIERTLANKLKLYDEYRRRLRLILEEGCQLCGERDIAVLQFHHADGKDFNIVEGVWSAFSWKRIVGELKKCVCLCANCHRKVHYYGLSVEKCNRCVVSMV